MKQITADLWQTRLYSSGMLNSHAYFLQRPAEQGGNVLFYNSGDNAELAEMEQMGGVSHQLLTHRDEAGPSLARIRQRFASTLVSSEKEAPYISRHSEVDVLLDQHSDNYNGIQVLHTPGHTDGSLSFFYESPHGQSYLFSGDTFFLWNGNWTTFVLSQAGGNQQDMLSSLQLLKTISPDLVLSSGFVGEHRIETFSDHQWHSTLDQQIARLSRKSA